MRTIRTGIFETNSSSTHSITIVSKAEYEKWKNGELLFNKWDEEFVPVNTINPEDLKKEYLDANAKELSNGYMYNDTFYPTLEELYSNAEISEDELEEFKDDRGEDTQYYTYKKYYDEIEYETYEVTHKTPSGDEIVAFGYYGEDR